MKGRLHPGRRRCAAGRVGLRPGTKGRLRPWDGKLPPGMRLSPGIKGTPHPGMEMSPREWETAPGQTLLLPRRGSAAALRPREGWLRPGRPASPSGGHRVRAGGAALPGGESAPLGCGRAPPGIGLHPRPPPPVPSPSPSRGRGVRVGCSARRAARGGKPAGDRSRPEQSGATGGPR